MFKNNKTRKFILIFVLGLILIFIGFFIVLTLSSKQYSKKPSQTNLKQKLQVVASFYPLYFFSQQIGGNRAQVFNVVPAGAEPHDYEPSARDMVRIEDSRLIILNGGDLEPWGNSVRTNINPEKTIIIIAGKNLTTRKMNINGETGIDPHIWLNPKLAQKMVDNILQGFIKADPENKIYYKHNADRLEQELNNLDLAYKKGLSNCQEKNIITSHAAFAYLSARYGLRQVSIAGLSPDAEPSSKKLAGIVNFVKKNGIKYIFFENLASPKLSQTIARETGAKTLVLDPLEGLTPEEIKQGQNYFTEMRKNLLSLQLALNCQR